MKRVALIALALAVVLGAFWFTMTTDSRYCKDAVKDFSDQKRAMLYGDCMNGR